MRHEEYKLFQIFFPKKRREKRSKKQKANVDSVGGEDLKSPLTSPNIVRTTL